MKTSTAVGVHATLGAAQAGALLGGFQAGLPWWGNILIQVGMLALQGWAAHANSNTDQNGNRLPPPQ